MVELDLRFAAKTITYTHYRGACNAGSWVCEGGGDPATAMTALKTTANLEVQSGAA
jgi:hypothetical protein